MFKFTFLVESQRIPYQHLTGNIPVLQQSHLDQPAELLRVWKVLLYMRKGFYTEPQLSGPSLG